jgi:subtilisin family serine protease
LTRSSKASASPLLLMGNETAKLSDIYDAAHDRYLSIDLPPPAGSSGLTGHGVVGAVVDTGILGNHPDIRGQLVESIDFTAEGPEDRIGHGTLVTLLALATAPQMQIVNVKVLSGAEDAVENLVSAFDWISVHPTISVVNVSAGAYTPGCFADCQLCSAARRASSAGKIVTVAAGNIPGVTACPAKASDAVITIAALNPLSRQLQPYSGSATRDGFVMPSPQPVTRWISGASAKSVDLE